MFCLGHPNRIEHIWDVIGRMVRIITAICNGRMERTCTVHMSEVCCFDAISLPGRHSSEWRPCQVVSQMIFVVMIEFRNFINVLL